MAIPNGYRLLTVDDVGKTFGVDLEQIIYFDTSADMSYFKSYALTWVGGVIEGPQAGQLFMVFDDVLVWDFRTQTVPSPYWIYDNYTVPSGTTIESVISNFTWNTFLYVKDIEEETSNNSYNITTDKKYLTINCKDKTMQEDLNITFEGSASTVVQWDGAYEEISSGYTVTLYRNTNNFNAAILNLTQYSIDGGNTWITFGDISETTAVVIENVERIRFKNATHPLFTSYSQSGYGDGVSADAGSETSDIEITQDTTIYIAVEIAM